MVFHQTWQKLQICVLTQCKVGPNTIQQSEHFAFIKILPFYCILLKGQKRTSNINFSTICKIFFGSVVLEPSLSLAKAWGFHLVSLSAQCCSFHFIFRGCFFNIRQFRMGLCKSYEVKVVDVAFFSLDMLGQWTSGLVLCFHGLIEHSLKIAVAIASFWTNWLSF